MPLAVIFIATPAAWSAMDPEGKSWKVEFNQATTGFMGSLGANEAYAVNGLSQDQIDEIVTELDTDIDSYHSWDYGKGVDEGINGVPQASKLVSMMFPHVEYDENGDPISSEPATLTNPNFGTHYYGQAFRRWSQFSGQFSSQFL